jgi:uncharacterized protein YjlB
MGDRSIRERLLDEGLEPYAWSNGPGDRYAVHRHDYDKVIGVESGSIAFGLGDAARIPLDAGDRLELPAGTDHDALVGAEGVRCLEAHLPAGSLPSGARRVRSGSW